MRPLVTSTLAALVLIAWFVWPFESIGQDPLGALLAAVRATLLFAVTLWTTTFVADHVTAKNPQRLRVAVGFAIATSITAGISVGLVVTAPVDRSEQWWPLMIAAAADGFWCAVAIWFHDWLNGRILSGAWHDRNGAGNRKS
jgi:hypothetical protein